jgi:hypothetical protein
VDQPLLLATSNWLGVVAVALGVEPLAKGESLVSRMTTLFASFPEARQGGNHFCGNL